MTVDLIDDDPEHELQMLGEWDAAYVRAQRRGLRWAPDFAVELGEWADSAPWMEPEAMLSLAESGVTARSAAGREAITAAGEDYWQGWRGGREPGERTRAGDLVGPGFGRYSRFGAASAAAAEDGRIESGAPKALVRMGATDPDEAAALGDEAVQAALTRTPLEQVAAGDFTAEQLMASVPGVTWDQIAEIHNQAVQVRALLRERFGDAWVASRLEGGSEGARPERVERPDWMEADEWSRVSGYVNGDDPYPEDVDPATVEWLNTVNRSTTPAGSTAALPSDVQAAISEGRFDPTTLSPQDWTARAGAVRTQEAGAFRNPILPVARVAFMALNSPLQEVGGQFRDFVDNVQNNGWAGALNPFTAEQRARHATYRPQNDLAIALEKAAKGEEVDLGTGFFVSPESGVGQERLRREQQYNLIDGHVITPGRWAVDTFTGLDPGDTGFGAASGLIDAAVAIGADPVDWAGGRAIRSLRATRRGSFAAIGALDEVEQAEQAVGGLVDATARRQPAAIASDLGVPDDVRRFVVNDLAAVPPATTDELARRGWAIGPDAEGRLVGERPSADLLARLEQQAIDEPDEVMTQIIEGQAERARAALRQRPWFLEPDDAARRGEEVGLIPGGAVPTTDQSTLAGWLTTSQPGQEVVDHFAADDNAYTIWKASDGRISPQGVLAIAATDDRDSVLRILFNELRLTGDRGFRYRPPTLHRSTWVRRAFTDMPVDRISTQDGEGFLHGLEAVLVNGRVPDDVLSSRMTDAMAAQTPVGRVAVYERALDDVASVLADDFGIAKEDALKLTRHIGEEHQDRWRLFNTTDGVAAPAFGDDEVLLINGEAAGGVRPRAHLTAEMAPEFLQVPNTREIRRLTGAFRKMSPLLMDATTGRLTAPARFIDNLQSNVWKRITLLRLAWPVRQVLIDEQLRLMASGLPSIWRHPIHLLSSVLLDSRMERRMLELADEPNGVLTATSEWQGAQLASLSDMTDVRRRALGVWGRVERGSDDFVEAWGRELGQLWADPVSRRLAQTGSVDSVVDDLLGGDLAPLREEAARIRPTLADESGVREWVDSIFQRLQHKTGGNDDLLDAVANGGLRSYDGGRLWFTAPGRNAPSDGFHDLLATMQHVAPDAVKGEAVVHDSSFVGTLDRASNQLFALFGGMPSNKLSRAPTFRWHYLDTLADKMPLLSPEAQEQALAVARRYRIAGTRIAVGGHEFGFGDDLLSRMERGAASGSGEVAWAEADQFARIQAVGKTQDLLGDLMVKNQLADAARVIAPFGNAWREAMTAYMRLIKENPLVLYDVAKGAQGAVESGFFYHDNQGELVFAYPGSANLLAHMPGGPGVPFPMTGRVQGLTMMFEVMPGLGPVATFPLSSLIPNTPKWDGLRQIAVPYGTEAGTSFLVPEWMEKLATGMANADPHGGPLNSAFRFMGQMLGGDTPQSSASFAASMIDVANYLVSTGEYDLSNEAGVADLMDDARRQAVSLWAWRGLAQFGAPAAPRPNPVFDTGNGDTILVATMLERLQALREQDPLTAGQQFLTEYGDLAFGLLSPKSESNALYIPWDTEGYDWAREHRDIMDRFPMIGGLFAPSGGGPAGIGAWLRAVEEGERSPVDPQEWLYRGQDGLASILYGQMRDTALENAQAAGRTAIPAAAQAILRDYRGQLMQQYPGYLRDGQNLRDIQRTITDLREAMDNEPVLANSDAGTALAEYLALRDQAVANLQAAGMPGLTSAAADRVRQVLMQEGERLVGQHPDFVNLWQRVLLREVEIADEEVD